MTDSELQIPESTFDAKARQRSWIVSIGFHVGVLFLLMFVTCSQPSEPQELVEITWGGSGGVPGVNAPEGPAPKGSPDATPQQQTQQPKQTSSAQPQQQTPRNPNNPALETPSEQQSTTTPDQPADTEDPTDNNSDAQSSNTNDDVQGRKDGTGSRPASGSGGKTSGSYSLEGFGTRGWLTPPGAVPPDGTTEEGEVILSFTVLPNGEITAVRPIKNASRTLTNLAVRAIKNAKARALPSNAVQQPVVCRIKYTFRLK